MRNLALRFGVAAIACLVGILASVVVSNVRSSRPDDQQHHGLVTVQADRHLAGSWPKAPARISVSEVQRSYDQSEVDITLAVQSLNGKSIAGFEVWAVKSSDNVVYQHKRILAHSVPKNLTELLSAATEYTETVCVSLDRGLFRKRIDNVELYLAAVEFTDGTMWHVPFEL
ncbi:MAG TPA: hypothetical protein VF251_01855 [Pyrinomonadaceae bacterium]